MFQIKEKTSELLDLIMLKNSYKQKGEKQNKRIGIYNDDLAMLNISRESLYILLEGLRKRRAINNIHITDYENDGIQENGYFIPFCELDSSSDPGIFAFKINEKFYNYYKAFKKGCVSENCSGVNAILLPPNTRWENVKITFLNEYDIKIKIGEKEYSSNYADLGFADKRKNVDTETKAIDSWKELKLMASQNSIIDLSQYSSAERAQKHKQIQTIEKNLMEKFPTIPGRPIERIKNNQSASKYKIKLMLVPLPVLRDDYRDTMCGIREEYENQINDVNRGRRRNYLPNYD